jgi:hypothetical protein
MLHDRPGGVQAGSLGGGKTSAATSREAELERQIARLENKLRATEARLEEDEEALNEPQVGASCPPARLPSLWFLQVSDRPLQFLTMCLAGRRVYAAHGMDARLRRQPREHLRGPRDEADAREPRGQVRPPRGVGRARGLCWPAMAQGRTRRGARGRWCGVRQCSGQVTQQL